MKKLILLTTITCAFITSAFTILHIWKADEKTSTVNFELSGSDKKGTFSNLVTTINFDKKKLPESKITASIDVNTMKAGNDVKIFSSLINNGFFFIFFCKSLR